MSEAPHGLRPGSILADRDPRTRDEKGNPTRFVTLKAVGKAPKSRWWFAYYQGTNRRHRIRLDRVHPAGEGLPTLGYTIVSL